MPSSFKFSKAVRLITAKDFLALKQASKKISTDGIRVISKNNNQTHPRLGLVIAKREVAKAVNRNYYKRVIRESFRLNQDRLVGNDIIVIISKKCLALSRKNFRLIIDKLWAKLIK